MTPFEHNGRTLEEHVYGECDCASCPKNFVPSPDIPLGAVVSMTDSEHGFYQSYGHWQTRSAAADLLIRRYLAGGDRRCP